MTPRRTLAAVLTAASVAALPASASADASFGPVPEREDAWDVPGALVVDARDDADPSALDAWLASLGVAARRSASFEETRVEVIEAPGLDLSALAARLRGDARVERVEPLARVRALFEPNDPMLRDQWHMHRIGAPAAWDFSTGRGATVAVVDTGIACEDHGPFAKGTDLARTACVSGWNFVSGDAHANDDQGHGTHVAGTIAQSTDNALGVTGVAFHARLMPVKVLNQNGWGTTVDVADGIRWAADHGAHVINLSLGGPRNSGVLQSAVDHALAKGVVVVAAAGNSGGSVGFPGRSEGVIGVSAVDPDDKLAKFSSRGPGVDLAAPGVGVVQQTICKGGRDGCEVFPGWNGTSMASPHVAGAAALLVAMGVTDARAVERILGETARRIDGGDAAHYGAGILDVRAATLRVFATQAAARLVALFALTGLLLWITAKAGRKGTSPIRPSFALGALWAGPGLLFFAPLLLARAHLWVDVLARPLGDLDLYVGASLHRLLPLANALVPFGLTALLYGSRAARPFVAGVATGTAAYLAATLALGHHASPLGSVGLAAWCVVNGLACVWIARTNLVDP